MCICMHIFDVAVAVFQAEKPFTSTEISKIRNTLTQNIYICVKKAMKNEVCFLWSNNEKSTLLVYFSLSIPHSLNLFCSSRSILVKKRHKKYQLTPSWKKSIDFHWFYICNVKFLSKSTKNLLQNTISKLYTWYSWFDVWMSFFYVTCRQHSVVILYSFVCDSNILWVCDKKIIIFSVIIKCGAVVAVIF